MQDFVKKNLWNLLTLLIVVSMGWAFFSSRLTTVEAQTEENRKKLIEYSSLVERVIRLEENRNSIIDDVSEIKEDIKALKEHFNLP